MIDYGNGILLDVLSSGDADITRECRNDTAVRKWCRQVGLISNACHQKWLSRQAEDSGMEMFAVRRKNEALDFLGVAGLTSINYVARHAEFSLYIKPSEQQNGYGKLALLSILKFGFYDLNLNRIWGESFEGNPAISMFSEIGFEKEGRRKEFYFKDGNFLDAHLISIGRRKFDAMWFIAEINGNVKAQE